MKHHLIPARNAAIVDALEDGADPADVAEFWGLNEHSVTGIGRDAGLDIRALGQARRDRLALASPDAHWKPSAAALAVLDSIGWDLDDAVQRRPRCSERDRLLLETIVLNDLTLAQAGERFDITRERVRQVLVKHTGLTTSHLAEYRGLMREASRVANGTMKAQRLIDADPTASVREIADASGLTSPEVADLLGPEETLLRRTRNTWTVGVPEVDAVAEIRRVAALPGGVPLAGPFYDRHRADGALSQMRLVQRYGTWSQACLAAGVEPRKAVRENYQRKWTEENLTDWALHYLDATGMFASYRGFQEWLRLLKHHDAPSAETVRNALGTWSAIIDLATVRRREIAGGAVCTVPVPPECAEAIAERYAPLDKTG